MTTGLQAQTKVQSPSEYLGYKLGSQWTPHHKVMDYFKYVAEQSPLVKSKKYGRTNEGRELLLAYVSGKQNMQRLQQIRSNNLKRTGIKDGEPTADSTAIVWLSYNVHGDEASSSEAAMKTVYELARPGNSQTKNWLQNTVVIMDPMVNPDGRDRYVHWNKETTGESVNARGDAREHHQPWPGGRTNHYYFDLNRDWAWLTQKESRQRISEYQKWMPQVHVDYHEMGYRDPYYFAPASKPFHNAITDWQKKFQFTIGENNVEQFNKHNWLFFTREVFDLFYPSYGDTYPIFNGAIGMTYEQGGGGYAGLGIQRPKGDTLSLNDRMMHHYITGLATIESSAKHAKKLVSEFEDYYQTAQKQPQGDYKTFVIKGDNNPDKLQEILQLLNKHNIEFGKATTSGDYRGYNYQEAKTEQVHVSSSDYIVSAYQPKSTMAQVLLEPDPELADSLTYDITAWSQFYAYGLDGYSLHEQLETESASIPKKEVDNSTAAKPYAYLARWEDPEDVAMLGDLLQENISVRVAETSFKINDQEYDRGTLVITRADNKPLNSNYDSQIQKIATNHNQQLYPVSTGFVQSGSDLGSSSMHLINNPRVALLSGSGTSSGRVGEVWHYFDKQIDYPVTILDTSYFNQVDLDQYDVLIVPPFYRNKPDEAQLKRIKKWISSGGKLIAMHGANQLLAAQKGFNLSEKNKDSADSTRQGKTQKIDQYSQRQRASIPKNNPGSIYDVSMDPSHPLAYGFNKHYFSLKVGSDSYKYLKDGWNVGVTKKAEPVSGFSGHKAQQKIEHSLTFGVQQMGEGSVVYMIDNPLFRAFWYNGKLLFGNAVFLVGQ